MASIAQPTSQESKTRGAVIDYSGANFFALACAIVILFAFIFMPWAGSTLQNNGARMMSDSVVGPFPEFFTYEPVTIFLVPIVAMVALVVALWGIANVDSGRLASRIIAIAGVAAFIYFLPVLMTTGEGPVHSQGAGGGFWVTIFACLGLIGQVLIAQPAINQRWQGGTQRLSMWIPTIPRRFVPYMFLIGPLLLYLVWIIGPTIYTFYLSVTNWDGITDPVFRGLYNYERLFGFGQFASEVPEEQLGAVLSSNLGALGLAAGFLAAIFALAYFTGDPVEYDDEQRIRRNLYLGTGAIALVTWILSMLSYNQPVFPEGEVLGTLIRYLIMLAGIGGLAYGVLWAWYDYNMPNGLRLVLITAGLTVALWFVFSWLDNPGNARDNFVVALINNIRWLVVFITVPTTLGLGLAMVFNNEMRGGRWYKVSFYGPLVLSLPVIGLVWSWIYNPRLGLINSLLRGIGMTDVPGWLAEEELAIWCIIIAAVWRQVGYVMVLYLAGLKNIDPTLVDAALVDGANRRQLFSRVVLPLLSPVTTIVIIISIIDSLRSFDLVQIMTRGNTNTEVLANLMYMEAFNNYQMGYGAAIAVVLFAISMIFIFFYLRSTIRTELDF